MEYGNPAHFKPGCQPGPGRPKGAVGGRARILMVLDELLGETEEVEEMKNALRDYLHKDRIKFFKTIIMPLLPQETKLRLEADGVIQWQSLLVTQPIQPNDLSIMPVASASAPSVAGGVSERPALRPPNSSTSDAGEAACSPGSRPPISLQSAANAP